MDFYKQVCCYLLPTPSAAESLTPGQKKFTCEITGRSVMSFFDALKSETTGSKEVDDSFPEPLRSPVLRRVQFSTVSRIDHLVDQVYDDFKLDFYPGESVQVIKDDGNKVPGIVREKSYFPAQIGPDGTMVRNSFSTYLVKLLERGDEEAMCSDTGLVRERKSFTKQMLRSFIKNTVTRDSWTGAPWLVKENIAKSYHIDTEVPPHLQYSTKAAERKANAAAKKSEQDGLYNFAINARGLPELKPAVKGKQQKLTPEEKAILAHGGLAGFSPEQALEEYQRSLQANTNIANPVQAGMHSEIPGPILPPGHVVYTQPNGQHIIVPAMPIPQPVVVPPSPPPPPPPIKYPIEDMDIAPERDGSCRPPVYFLCDDPPTKSAKYDEQAAGVKMVSIGLLLETWTTLNAYSEVFQLDSFTFDDFVEAMKFSATDVDCELLTELHCAVLKRLVNGENDQNGSIQISLPDFPQDEDDEDESMESSLERTPTPEPKSPPRRTTRSSLNKQPEARRSRSSTAEVKIHRAGEMFDGYSWLQRLRKRDFKNGGWQMILIGLLHQLSSKASLQESCEAVLAFLAPLDADPTQETAKLQYAVMDINLRAKALQIITMLTMETKAIKLYLEQCAAQMTEYRKEKIEYQRARKFYMEELRKLHDERKIHAPEARSPTPPPELKSEENGDVEMTNEIEDTEAADSDDEEPLPGRSLRHAKDRAAERKRKREEEQERRERAEAAKQSKGTKIYQKILKRIEEEQQKIRNEENKIAEMDIKLRRTDRPRTRCLGRDRFWNRYFWFERNAMPFEGSPESSTADAQYSNGRLWIQGPDDMEREGYIDVPPQQQAAYKHHFSMTPLQRKEVEEGHTSVYNARQWGYIDDPDALDEVIAWLDTRGVREAKLRKELQAQRDLIAKYMRRRQEYLGEHAEQNGVGDEDSDEEEPLIAPTRMSTRRKEYVQLSSSEEKQLKLRCLRWKNETAIREYGCRHVDGLPPPSKRARGKKKKKVVEEEPEEIEEEPTRGVSTRLKNRQGKPLTRQGGRYAF
ncbi:MAG: hypothetical protein Q9227_008717 [Pyrenula ochraceoflavens]